VSKEKSEYDEAAVQFTGCGDCFPYLLSKINILVPRSVYHLVTHAHTKDDRHSTTD